MVVTSADAILNPLPPSHDLAQTLGAISHPLRLEILSALGSGASAASEIAGELRIEPAQARRHLRALVASGLIRSYPADDGERFRFDEQSVALLNASLVSLLSRPDSSPAAGIPLRTNTWNVFSLDVPLAPEACATCQNSAFVGRVLDDLDRAIAEAREYHSRLQQLSSQVLGAHEAERKRIARELHDDTAQSLTSILVRLRLLERSVDDSEVRQNIAELRELTGNALDSVRRMAVDLRPTALDDLGLVAALRSYVEKFSTRWPIRIEFSSNGLQRRLPAEVELVMYRIVQEALSNVAKHSGARSVQVALSRRRNAATAVVSDDGRGFDIDKVIGSRRGGLGLFGMKERLALVGGSLQIESGDRGGTQVTARVPLPGLSHRHN